MLDKGFTYRAKLSFGKENLRGFGPTPELARRMADLFCMQRTRFCFEEEPPGFASDIAVSNSRHLVWNLAFVSCFSRSLCRGN